MAQTTMIVLLASAVAAVTFAASDVSLDLRIIPAIPVPSSSSNMTLLCNATELWDGEYRSLSSLKILKNYQDGWKILAQVTDLAPTFIGVLDYSLHTWSGSLVSRHPNLGFISLTWDRPTSDTFGEYMCLATKINAEENEIVTKTASLTVGSDLQPLDLLLLMIKDKTEVREKIQDLSENLNRSRLEFQSTVDTNLTTFSENLNQVLVELNNTLEEQDRKLEALKVELTDLLNDTGRSMVSRFQKLDLWLDTAVARGFFMKWPRGSYGLPMTSSGCPSSSEVSWREGWRKHHTASPGDNNDDVSDDHHLNHPVMIREDDQNFIYQRFCVKLDSDTNGPFWPSGSYCINRVNGCPKDFSSGHIRWGDEHQNFRGESDGNVPDSELHSYATKFLYCCRNDSSADMSVNLPQSDPFYLYRHGGQCQEVAGMTVTQEFIVFDTDNSASSDEANGSHPDVEIAETVKLHLCYYE